MRDVRSFDRVADVYDATRGLPPDAEAAVGAGLCAVLHRLAPAPRLLEVGIGTGRIAVPAAAAGVRVVGVDVAPRMLARLRAKRSDIALVLADAAALPFRHGCFDAVLLVHVLHLVPDAPGVLRAAARVLRRGGALLLGRTDYAESPRGGVLRMAREVVAEVTGVRREEPAWNAIANAAFAQVAADLGTTVEESVLARWPERATGAELLDQLARRVYSSSWSIPDAAMPEVVRRLTPRVAAMLGGLDAAIDTGASFTLVAAHLPA